MRKKTVLKWAWYTAMSPVVALALLFMVCFYPLAWLAGKLRKRRERR